MPPGPDGGASRLARPTVQVLPRYPYLAVSRAEGWRELDGGAGSVLILFGTAGANDMKRRMAAVAAGILVGWASGASAADQPADSVKPPRVALARIVSSIPDGAEWATFRRERKSIFTIECDTLPDGIDKLIWHSDNDAIDRRRYLSVFADELKAAGFVPADDPANLFQKDRGDADIQVAANIKAINATFCLSYIGAGMHIVIGAPDQKPAPSPPPKPDFDRIYGDIVFDVDWQVYSRAADKVVGDIPIKSSFSTTGHVQGNYERLILGGIRENIRQLLSSADFKTAVTGAASPGALVANSQPKLLLTVGKAAKPIRIADAVGSVVVILSAGGHGSGFLLSSDGYLLTAAHVVGADKYVKIRWSDGLEGVGEVIRSDARRDVAIIKADPRGRPPLALRQGAAQPGETVFAIGAPIDPKLQSTVTRGVVSANRIMDGFSYIQSDVTVDPGNSGGPLLDEKGQVLGFTDKGLRTPEAPTGLNFFVPIDDALRFLSAEPR